MRRRCQSAVVVAVALSGATLLGVRAFADTIESALIFTYINNPQLNSQRALVRATDENVPTALAGYRPKAAATASAGFQSLNTRTWEIGSTTPPNQPRSTFIQSGTNYPRSFGATVTQTLLNGSQTANRT